MFRQRPRPQQEPSVRVVNRILTIGLVLFLAYSVFNSDLKKAKPEEAYMALGIENSTPIHWERDINIYNYTDGTNEYQLMQQNNRFTLKANRQKLEALLKKSNGPTEKEEQDEITLYDIEINTE